jgi:hypothetical protein
MLEGDYSPSEFDDEQPSAASHVDLEQVVEAISDLVGADYGAKYSVSSFIEYNAEQYVPSSSFKERTGLLISRSDGKKFDKSKGYGGRRFCQAVFGFEKSIIPSAKLRRVVLGSTAIFSRCSRSRENLHLAETRGPASCGFGR